MNDSWHSILSPEQFAQDCHGMIRTPQVSGSALHAFLAATPIGCDVLALVEAPDVDLVAAFAKEHPAAIEIGNELELAPYELKPSQYADWIGRAAVTLKGLDYQGVVVLGGVYAITNETKQAILLALDSCTAAEIRCVIGVHLYDVSDEDLAWLWSLNWPIWTTEVGFPIRCDPNRVQQQADYLRQQITRFSTVPRMERVFLYQRPFGSSCSDLDTFGLGPPALALLQ